MKCLIENIEVNYPCSPACSLYGDCMTEFLKTRKQRVRTNADSIRAMTDEELAEFFVNIAEGVPSDDPAVWLEWLREPAEGE